MSLKSNHEQELLLFLSKNQGYVTSKDILKILNISQKTVYRLIKKINEAFVDAPLIISERGRGYKLDYEKYINYQKGNETFKEKHVSPNERRKRIMEELLLYSPKYINIYHLFSKYYVGDSVISNDEQIMNEELKKFNLVLVRKNRALAILGEEVNIRRAIKDSIEIFNTIDIDDLKRNQELNFNQYDVLFILDQLRKIEEDLDITIPYPYNINIFSHLYILLSRLRKVPTRLFTNTISSEEMENMKRDILYPVTKVIVHNIENYLNSSLPSSEIYFLYQYLVSSRMQGSLVITSTFSLGVSQITKAYIEGISTSLGINIDRQSIFIDLANHIKPMLNRLEHKIQINNSLLSQIKVTYEEVFLSVTSVSESVSKTFNLPAINDDENGFLTLYFAKAIETGQHQRPIKILIMCTTGIGTSELLKTKVSKKFPELEIVDVVASRNTRRLKEKYSDAELILSTVHIKEEVPIPYLLVSAMFTIDDQKRLQRKIEEIYHEDQLLYQIHFNCQLKTKEEVYSFISEIVCQDNPLHTEEVINQLNEREKVGNTVIAEHVMLPHIESNQLKKSHILFIRLADPIRSWDDQIKDICLLIVIVLRKNESVRIKKKISLFTRALADEEYLNRLLNSHEKESFIKEILKIEED